MHFPPIAVVNGRAGDGIAVLDRGLMYGDGVFRTLRVQNGQPLWWEDHLHRLEADAARLCIPAPSHHVWQADLDRIRDRLPADAVLKLVLTRGSGQRGYLPPEHPEPTRILIAGALPAHLEEVATRGARLRLCTLRLAEQPLLAGIKHLNRLENVLARREWTDPAIDEGLLADAAGRVVCGVSSNLFLHLRGELVTPDLDRCGVAGVARSRLLARAARLKLPVRVADIGLDDLYAAEEVMLSNSLIKLWPVARLEGRTWEPGPLGTRLRALLDD